MRIYRIYHPFSTSDVQITLGKDSSHHLATVLRCQVGDHCQVFDGKGHEIESTIEVVNKSQVILRALQSVQNSSESPLTIHLFQALCKGEKMDWIIQKSIELGVTEITPIITERCDVKLSHERIEKKLAHWRHIIINATEQSGRAVLAELHPARSFSEAIMTTDLKLLLTPSAKNTLRSLVTKPTHSIAIYIGPEGGFSEKEIIMAENEGIHCISLGKRIMRTETAPLAAIATLQTLLGDFL